MKVEKIESLRNAERDLAAYYFGNRTPASERQSIEVFADPVARAIIEELDGIGDDAAPIEIHVIQARLVARPFLPADLSTFSLLLRDPAKTELPSEIAKCLEKQVSEGHAERELRRALIASQARLEEEGGAYEVATSLQSEVATIAALVAPEWEPPLPFTTTANEKPYPVHAFPGPIFDAVEEVYNSMQAPLSMVSLSALSQASLSVQHLANVRRDTHLEGPISLYTLIIAASGERKSACDKLFSAGIRAFQKSAIAGLADELSEWKAAHARWIAEREGVKAAIKNASASAKSTDELGHRLRDLEKTEPVPPRVPNLLFENETPQSLRVKLSYMTAKSWLSAGLMTAEGGNIFGGNGMNRESSLDYLSLLNSLWDGADIMTGRRGDGDHHISGARLTVGISVQEEVHRAFLAASLSIQSGNVARFLIAWPESTRGTRLYKPSGSMPKLIEFQRQSERFLEAAPLRDEQGQIIPAFLSFSPGARKLWIAYYNEVERNQGPGGLYRGIPDIASKSADQAARLAGSFHFWNGETVRNLIAERTMYSACEVARWHLDEAKRYLEAGGRGESMEDSMALERWLVERLTHGGNPEVSRRDIQQAGPNRLRDPRRLSESLSTLEALRRLRMTRRGKSVMIRLNPALLSPANG